VVDISVMYVVLFVVVISVMYVVLFVVASITTGVLFVIDEDVSIVVNGELLNVVDRGELLSIVDNGELLSIVVITSGELFIDGPGTSGDVVYQVVGFLFSHCENMTVSFPSGILKQKTSPTSP